MKSNILLINVNEVYLTYHRNKLSLVETHGVNTKPESESDDENSEDTGSRFRSINLVDMDGTFLQRERLDGSHHAVFLQVYRSNDTFQI